MIARPDQLPGTFAELHARLGGVPLERIRTKPAPGTATEEDLLRNTGPICELIDGVLVEKPVGNRESAIALFIGSRLRSHIEPGDLGVVLTTDGHIRVRPGQLRAPDATYIPWTAFPGGEPPEDEAYWTVSPVLVVEVLSPDNTKAEIDRKLRELFVAGCKLAWVIDPRARTAKVYTTAVRFKVLDESGVLVGGRVLPGFKLPLADVFASDRPRKKKPR